MHLDIRSWSFGGGRAGDAEPTVLCALLLSKKKKEIILDSTTSSSHFHPTSLLSFIEKSPLKSWPNPVSTLFSFSFEPFSVRLSSPLLIESILFNVTNLLYQMVNSQSSIQFLGNIWHY